jgi:predicted ATPase
MGLATIASLEGGRRRRPYPSTVAALAEALSLSTVDRAELLDLAHGPRERAAEPATPRSQLLEPAANPRVRLPLPPTSLLGRADDVAGAAMQLDPARSEVRLLTMLGPGGVGKTRLAIAVASVLADAYPDGVIFVDLAPLHDERLVPATIARALDIRESLGRSAREMVLERLREQHLLLVLDNFEHLTGAAPVVAELLTSCLYLRVLVTSRTALRLRSERRFVVHPLEAPHGDRVEFDVIAASAAVQLFIDRAQAVAPEFALDRTSAPYVNAICRHLDGIPLAIELAAARVAVLSPKALMQRLERGLFALAGGAVDLPSRQRALRNTVAWSHDLLLPAERTLLRRLAVFAGGWTAEAAEAVCASPEWTGNEVLDGLVALVDSSLIQHSVGVDRQERFTMLETIREYALEQLQQAGEAEEVRRRHLEWCVALVEPIEPGVLDPTLLAPLTPEHSNLRAGLRAAIETRHVEAGLRIAASMWLPWYLSGSYTEGRGWIVELLSLPVSTSATAARGYALAAVGHLAYCEGDFTASERMLEDARLQAEELGNELLGGLHVHLQANLARARGELTRARSLHETALATFRRLNHQMLAAISQVVLARVLYELGESQLALMHAAESYALFRDSGNHWGMGGAQYVQAGIDADAGNLVSARAGFEACIAHYQAIDELQGLGWSLLALGHVLVSLGEESAARQHFGECLTLAQRAGDRLTLARGLEGLAGTLAAESPQDAVRLAAAGDSVRAHVGASRPPRDELRFGKWIEQTRRALDPAMFEKTWAAGYALEASRAVAEALEAATAPLA